MESDALLTRLERVVSELRRTSGLDLEAVNAELAAATGKVEQLTTAVEHRTVMGQATGLVMARFGLCSDAAFQVLVKHSMQTNRKVYEISTELVGAHDAGAAAATDERPMAASATALRMNSDHPD